MNVLKIVALTAGAAIAVGGWYTVRRLRRNKLVALPASPKASSAVADSAPIKTPVIQKEEPVKEATAVTETTTRDIPTAKCVTISETPSIENVAYQVYREIHQRIPEMFTTRQVIQTERCAYQLCSLEDRTTAAEIARRPESYVPTPVYHENNTLFICRKEGQVDNFVLVLLVDEEYYVMAMDENGSLLVSMDITDADQFDAHGYVVSMFQLAAPDTVIVRKPEPVFPMD